MGVLTKGRILFSVLTASVLSFVAVGLVLAWTYLGSFAGTKYWSPNGGEKWAQFVDDNYRNRYLDVEAYNFWYDSTRIMTMQQARYVPTSIVFHAFRRDTNCYLNMTATGYWWTNYPYAYPEFKPANCPGESYSGNNEQRIWESEPGYTLVAGARYYAGAEYKDRYFESGSGIKLGGEIAYDAYSCLSCKEYMGKFPFNRLNQFQ